MAARRQPWPWAAPGESGVSVYNPRFRGGVHFSATPHRHHIWFGSPVHVDCRIGGRTLRHEAPAASLAICPAGIDCGADAEESVDALVVAIDPSQLLLAAAESSALEAQLNQRLRGYDQALLDLARILALESAKDYPSGPLYWNEVGSGFVGGFGRSSHVRIHKPATRHLGQKTCSSGSETMSLPTSMSPLRSPRSVRHRVRRHSWPLFRPSEQVPARRAHAGEPARLPVVGRKGLSRPIQGRTCAKMFGLVERFIGAKVLEISQVTPTLIIE